MRAYDVTELVDFVEQSDGSIDIRAKPQGLGDWDILSAASNAGWVDPGFTEPLTMTIERAREYLRQAHSAGDAHE